MNQKRQETVEKNENPIKKLSYPHQKVIVNLRNIRKYEPFFVQFFRATQLTVKNTGFTLQMKLH